MTLPLGEVTTDLGDDERPTASTDLTTDTRNRDGPAAFAPGKKHVGEEPSDDGATGEEDAEESAERSDASGTRHTTKRLRDGLGIGLATGEGMGLGAGERRRPPLVRFGSSIVHAAGSSAAVNDAADRDEHGSV